MIAHHLRTGGNRLDEFIRPMREALYAHAIAELRFAEGHA